MATQEQKIQLARELVQHSAALLEAYQRTEILLERYFDLGLSGQYTADDFDGDLAHLNLTTFNNALSTIEAVKTLMDAGHRANLNQARR